MKHLIIFSFIALFSTSAFANAECDNLTNSIVVCYFDSSNGLEIFEDVQENQIARQETAEDGSLITDISSPVLLGSDLDIKNCISEVYEGEAKATCFLHEDALSTARAVPNKLTILPRTPQKTVIKRVDRR